MFCSSLALPIPRSAKQDPALGSARDPTLCRVPIVPPGHRAKDRGPSSLLDSEGTRHHASGRQAHPPAQMRSGGSLAPKSATGAGWSKATERNHTC